MPSHRQSPQADSSKEPDPGPNPSPLTHRNKCLDNGREKTVEAYRLTELGKFLESVVSQVCEVPKMVKILLEEWQSDIEAKYLVKGAKVPEQESQPSDPQNSHTPQTEEENKDLSMGINAGYYPPSKTYPDGAAYMESTMKSVKIVQSTLVQTESDGDLQRCGNQWHEALEVCMQYIYPKARPYRTTLWSGSILGEVVAVANGNVPNQEHTTIESSDNAEANTHNDLPAANSSIGAQIDDLSFLLQHRRIQGIMHEGREMKACRM